MVFDPPHWASSVVGVIASCTALLIRPTRARPAWPLPSATISRSSRRVLCHQHVWNEGLRVRDTATVPGFAVRHGRQLCA
jgi:hypothetical protein